MLLLDDTNSEENRDLLMLMMMQGGNLDDSGAILPLLLLDDNSLYFKNFFLYSNMLRQGRLISEFFFVQCENSGFTITWAPVFGGPGI